MNTKTKNMLQHLEEHAENGQAEVKSFISKGNMEKMKQPRVLWAAAGVAALIGAGMVWRRARNKTKKSAK